MGRASRGDQGAVEHSVTAYPASDCDVQGSRRDHWQGRSECCRSARQEARLGFAPDFKFELFDAQLQLRLQHALERPYLRAIVTSKEAGVIIGKAGQNVADLRDKTGVRPGVSKVVGLLTRILSFGTTQADA